MEQPIQIRESRSGLRGLRHDPVQTPSTAGRSAQSIHFETQYNHVSPEDLDIERQCRVGPTKSHDIQA